MMKPFRLFLSVTALLFSATSQSLAAEHEIRMLNYGEGGGMVFEPDFIQAEPGDTIHFVATHASHFTQSYLVPEGASAWRSELGKDFSITLDVPGTYVYYCPPHLMMSMIGVIQVGDQIDAAAIEKSRTRLKPKLVMKGERLDNLLEKLESIQ